MKNTDNTIRSYKERTALYNEEKQAIIQRALLFIQENKTYFFDVSTTLQQLSYSLNKKVTVYTHSLDNAEILSQKKEISVYTFSGYLNKNNRYFYTPNYKNHFAEIEFDTAFLGAAAIMNDGVYYQDEEDAFFKREVVKKSKKVILLAEHQKYQNMAYHKGFDLSEITVVIVDPISVNSFVDILLTNQIALNSRSLIII